MPESLIIVHGKPGSGKSELSRRAVERADNWTPEGTPVRHLSIGSRYRSILAGETPSRLAGAVRESAADGVKMTPHDPELVHDLVREYLDGLPAPGVTLLDGYPKEPQLGEAVKRDFTRDGAHSVKGMVLVEVASQIAIDRVLQRNGGAGVDLHPDIDPQIARDRVAFHDDITAGVVSDLGERFGLYELDGSQDIDPATEQLITMLGHIMAESADS